MLHSNAPQPKASLMNNNTNVSYVRGQAHASIASTFHEFGKYVHEKKKKYYANFLDFSKESFYYNGVDNVLTNFSQASVIFNW